MMTIKDKLEAYRRKKQKEEMTESIKNVVRNVFLWNRNDGIKTSGKESTKEEEVRLYFLVYRENFVFYSFFQIV